MTRKDNRGRNLRTGESQRADGRYDYRYTDKRTGKRVAIYSMDLAELREMVKEILKDQEDGIISTADVKKMDVNELFNRYMSIRKLDETTRANYMAMWKYHVEDDLGKMKVVAVRPSHIKALYAKMSNEGYARSTIKYLHTMLLPAFGMAVEDDIIRKNPAVHTLGDYGREAKEKETLSVEDQEAIFAFVENGIYSNYLPLLQVMVGTAVRAGELIGLTWDDIDLANREVTIDHQLVYKNYGDGYKFHLKEPKTDAGVRTIPMTSTVKKAFLKQREYQMMIGIDRTVEVEGRKGFIFTTKNGTPIMPNALNNVLYNIVNAYNREELKAAQKQRRKEILMPSISAHTLRHTGCTRMAESGFDPKVLQYIMGHSNIAVTMEVYNHITGKERIRKEFDRIDEIMAG